MHASGICGRLARYYSQKTIPNHAHMPRSHVQWPGLSLVARWTKYIPDGSTTQLKRVRTGQASGIYGRLVRDVYPLHAHIPKSHVQWPGLSLVAKWTNIPGRLHNAIKKSKMNTLIVSALTGLFFPIYFRFPSVPMLRPVAFASLEPLDYVFLDVPDLGRRHQDSNSGIIVKGWHGTFIPHFHAHIPRSHVQWPGPSLGIWIGIKDARHAKWKILNWCCASLKVPYSGSDADKRNHQ